MLFTTEALHAETLRALESSDLALAHTDRLDVGGPHLSEHVTAELLGSVFADRAPGAAIVDLAVTEEHDGMTFRRACGANPLGVKGMGEGGAVASPAAVFNAVADALAPLGVRLRSTPLGPEQIFQTVRAARGRADRQ